eukprot:13805289-Heterocapsa_arctica.AAC.1
MAYGIASRRPCVLMLNMVSQSEALSRRGGAHLIEHPADLGAQPFPSVWFTDDMQNMEERSGSRRCLLH